MTDKNSITDARNLPFSEILNLYNRFDFDKQLNQNASKIAIGILTKWDKIRRPAHFSMGNKELAIISGLNSKKTNIHRNRELVIKRCIVNTIPLFSYISMQQKVPGIYIVNIDAFTYNFRPSKPDHQPSPLVTHLQKDCNESVPYRRYNAQELKHWQQLKKDLLEEVVTCEGCNARGKLELHHKTYKNWGNEKREDVVLLCRRCHKIVHTGCDANG